MGRREAIEALKPQLAKVLEQWTESLCETPEWEALGCYIGDETHLCMANAAMSVLDGISEVHAYLRKEGHDV